MGKKNKSNNIYYKNNEIFVLLLYIVCISVISYFHEP